MESVAVRCDDGHGDWPILKVAASCWEEERLRAFEVIYKAMRLVDDLVDERRKEGRPVSMAERVCIEGEIRRALAGTGRWQDVDGCELRWAKEQFALPEWPWQRWTCAMVRDLRQDGFDTWRDFLHYSLGAAAAPGAIFLHLAAACRQGDGRYLAPIFDIDTASRPIAFFAYTVHILRDFRKDQADGLNAFPRALLAAHGLDERALREAWRQTGDNERLVERVSALVRTYCRIAEHYRSRARRSIDGFSALLDPRARLSIEIVYELYLQLLEKARATAATVPPDLAVSSLERRERVGSVVARASRLKGTADRGALIAPAVASGRGRVRTTERYQPAGGDANSVSKCCRRSGSAGFVK